MTTIRRERIQKFRELILASELYFFAEEEPQPDLNNAVNKLAKSLADASISRSEQVLEAYNKPNMIDEAFKNPEIQKIANSLLGIESAIFEGRPVTQEDIDPAKNEHNALIAFESAFGVTHGNIGWHGVKKEWTRLRKFLTDLYLKDNDCFKKYRAWYDGTGKFKKAYGVMDLKRDPDGFALSWDMFMSEVGNSDQPNREEGKAFYA